MPGPVALGGEVADILRGRAAEHAMVGDHREPAFASAAIFSGLLVMRRACSTRASRVAVGEVPIRDSGGPILAQTSFPFLVFLVAHVTGCGLSQDASTFYIQVQVSVDRLASTPKNAL